MIKLLKFGMHLNAFDYHDLYLNCDVLLLVLCFRNLEIVA